MNKKVILSLFLFFSLVLTGCSKQMDELDGEVYHYKSEPFGFTLDLPKEFIYYQTQIKQGEQVNPETGIKEIFSAWQDLEVFVPTNDTGYKQEVPNYAKPVVVRVFEKDKYQEQPNFVKIGETEKRVYAISFWQEIPSDWKDKWSEESAKKISESFKIKD